MSHRIVTHVTRDRAGDITEVGQPGAPWSPRTVGDVIADIESGVHRYSVGGVEDPGRRIHVVHDENMHLRSGPDQAIGNNLDSLPLMGPGQPPASCPISWQPSVLAPVFYGIRDYGLDDDAPGRVRVFFPSLDGAVHSAPILEGCLPYPLVLFVHGNCADDDEHYKTWFELPAQLARSGYVVVAPDLPATRTGVGPWTDPHPDMDLLAAVLAWMRDGWEHHVVLAPEPSTGIVGHSYGALLAARFSTVHPMTAYASLSGVWSEWPPVPPSPFGSLDMPKLFTWGTGFGDVFAALGTAQWDSLTGPRHRAAFTDVGHWDYLPEGRSNCQGFRGSCSLVPSLAMDLVACLFAKYLPPGSWSGFDPGIPDSLIPPPLSLTAEQQFFAGAHLIGFQRLADNNDCEVELAWTTPRGNGTTTRPLTV